MHVAIISVGYQAPAAAAATVSKTKSVKHLMNLCRRSYAEPWALEKGGFFNNFSKRCLFEGDEEEKYLLNNFCSGLGV